MSLSTLLEAAKYLDYLDSNKSGQQQHQSPLSQHPQTHLSHSTSVKKQTRRPRSSKKDAANTMVAMSLPSSTATIRMQQGVPIPLASSSSNAQHHHHTASLSSSFTTGSPLSSFASTALLCSKASGATSATSSAASSLSSSDSSSSCGEILMGENDFNQPSPTASSVGKHNIHNLSHQRPNLETGCQPTSPSSMLHELNSEASKSFARYIAATSAGPQLVTMTTSSTGITSASAPIDGRVRAGHVIHAATNNTASFMNAGASGFDPRQFSIATAGSLADGQTFGFGTSTNLGSDNQLSASPASAHCPPLIMARVQPMILNSISPPGHQNVMAFQQAAASSPTSSSSSYSRHRELHKTLEKNRRAHLRHCFELLKAELPSSECADKKTSHINIIKSAIRYVLALRQQECEIDSELQRLTKIKTDLTEQLSKNRSETQSTMQTSTSPELSPSSPPPPSFDVIEVPAQAHLAQQSSTQQPVAEQQLSFLLSQSKID